MSLCRAIRRTQTSHTKRSTLYLITVFLSGVSPTTKIRAAQLSHEKFLFGRGLSVSMTREALGDIISVENFGWIKLDALREALIVYSGGEYCG